MVDLSSMLHTPSWLRALALAALAFVLLVAFQHVASRSVSQGELLRTAFAEHGDAVWRCNGLQGKALRQDCLARLIEPGALRTPP